MNCPTCRPLTPDGPYREASPAHRAGTSLLREKHPSGIEVDRCPSCYGLWLDPGEMERAETVARKRGRSIDRENVIADLFRRTYENARHRAEPRILDCPACDEVMFEREWTYGSQVRVDVCMACRGVWLDAGELDDLARFLGATWE